jgi:hypothetical protein
MNALPWGARGGERRREEERQQEEIPNAVHLVSGPRVEHVSRVITPRKMLCVIIGCAINNALNTFDRISSRDIDNGVDSTSNRKEHLESSWE